MQALDVLQEKAVPLIHNVPDLALLAKTILSSNVCSVALSDSSTSSTNGTEIFCMPQSLWHMRRLRQREPSFSHTSWYPGIAIASFCLIFEKFFYCLVRKRFSFRHNLFVQPLKILPCCLVLLFGRVPNLCNIFLCCLPVS